MSNPIVQPYLFFGGRCEEALDFYTAALGAKVEMVMRFHEAPDQPPEGMLQPGFEKKIMHSSFRVGDTVLFGSDGCEEGSGRKYHGFSLALSVPTEAEADRAFAALAADGKVTMPLVKTFWSPKYGMLTDKFGIEWMVMVPGGPAQ